LVIDVMVGEREGSVLVAVEVKSTIFVVDAGVLDIV
jgi:hypothetical protein